VPAGVTSRKELGIQLDKLNTGQQGTLAATKVDHTQGCMTRSPAIRLAEMITRFWVVARHTPSLESSSLTEIDQLERAQWRIMKMIRRLQYMMYEQSL